MSKQALKFSVIAAILVLSGCQTVPYQGQARDIKRKPQAEGVIAVPLNYRDEDRQRAQAKMNENCNPGEVKVLEEGEAVIGQEVKSRGKETDRASSEVQMGKLFGIPIVSGEGAGKNTESSSVTTAIKEWHISYTCVAKSTPAAAKGAKVRSM